MVDMLRQHKPGDQVTIHVMRDGKEQSLKVTLGERRRQGARGGPAAAEPREGGTAFLGVQTRPMSPEAKSQFKVDVNEGAVVMDVAPDTPASKAGFKPGDVIVKFDGKAIASPDDLREAVRGAKPGHDATVTVARGNKQEDLKAHLEESPVETRFRFPPMPQSGIRSPLGDGLSPPFGGDQETIQRLQRRIQELEARIREMEKKQAPPSK